MMNLIIKAGGLIIKMLEMIVKIMEKIIRMILNAMMVMIYQEMDALIIILNKIGIALLESNLSIHYVQDVILIAYTVHLMLVANYATMGIIIIMVIACNVRPNAKLA